VGEFEDNGYDKSDGEIIRVSEKAILFRQEDGEEIWVPQSVIHDNSEVWKKGDVGILIVKEWWAKKQEWI